MMRISEDRHSTSVCLGPYKLDMKYFFHVPLLAALVVAYPHGVENDNKMIINPDHYPKILVIYEGEHDIVDIMVPLNNIIDHDMSESQSLELSDLKKYFMVFFVEADLKDDHRDDQGIYMYRDGKVTKVLDKGRALAASADNSKYVFLGAKDGIYVYNPISQKADKYGTFSHSVKDMAKQQNDDVIYIITDDNELYKVYDSGTKEEKIDDVKDAEQIIMDYSNNLYYYGKDKQPYVRTIDGNIKKIEGLPDEPKEVRLLRPEVFYEQEVGLIVDNEYYIINSDGMSAPSNIEFMPEAKMTALALEAGIAGYIGYNKKIYEYDFLLESTEESTD